MPIEVGILPISLHLASPLKMWLKISSTSQQRLPDCSLSPLGKRYTSSVMSLPLSMWPNICLPPEAPMSIATQYFILAYHPFFIHPIKSNIHIINYGYYDFCTFNACIFVFLSYNILINIFRSFYANNRDLICRWKMW